MQTFRDPLHDNAKQESIEFLRSQIITMIQDGETGSVIDEIVQELSLRDIHQFMIKLHKDQNLPFKLPIVRHIKVEDEETFQALCEHMSINNVQMPRGETQRIYFVETDMDAITVIPIQLDPEDGINVRIELLEDSPKFVRELWYKSTRKKGLDDIEFVKLK